MDRALLFVAVPSVLFLAALVGLDILHTQALIEGSTRDLGNVVLGVGGTAFFVTGASDG